MNTRAAKRKHESAKLETRCNEKSIKHLPNKSEKIILKPEKKTSSERDILSTDSVSTGKINDNRMNVRMLVNRNDVNNWLNRLNGDSSSQNPKDKNSSKKTEYRCNEEIAVALAHNNIIDATDRMLKGRRRGRSRQNKVM